MPVTTDLAALQDVDRALDERRMALQQTDLRLAEGGALMEARDAVRESESRLKDLDTRQRAATHVADDLRAKIDAEERKLYGGAVVNTKELMALQEEVDSLKRLRDERDEVVLTLIGQAEDAGRRHATARERLREAQAERAALTEELTKRRAELEKAIADFEASRKTIAARVPADALAMYDDLRIRRQGRPVARIERNSCGGCRISLPVDTITRVRRGGTLVQCPSCERILYEP